MFAASFLVSSFRQTTSHATHFHAMRGISNSKTHSMCLERERKRRKKCNHFHWQTHCCCNSFTSPISVQLFFGVFSLILPAGNCFLAQMENWRCCSGRRNTLEKSPSTSAQRFFLPRVCFHIWMGAQHGTVHHTGLYLAAAAVRTLLWQLTNPTHTHALAVVHHY